MFENVIEAMIDAVIVVDVGGRISATNTAAARMTGYSTAELRDMPLSRLLLDEKSGVRTPVRRRGTGPDDPDGPGEPPHTEQSWLLTASGERIPVSVTGSPVLGAAGTVDSILIVARDVREMRQLLADKEAELRLRRRAEADLRALNASIEERLHEARVTLRIAERRATLGTLAAGVGHELRNIAQLQVSALEELGHALDAGLDVTAVAREVLPDLQRVTEHITAHGQRLLQLARPGPDLVESMGLGAIAHDVIAMMRGAGRTRYAQIVTALPATPLTVTVNRMRIEQILVNLVGNALDAIGHGPGTVTITAYPTPDGRRVRCEVHDTGPGIPEALREEIFQPFFTTKPPDEGTGLGLPVTREIVEGYGSRLEVTCPPGHGTTFTFELPV